MLYDYGWIRDVKWPVWRVTSSGCCLMHDPEAMTHASAEDLAHVLTTCVRADRFCDGYLADALKIGLIPGVVARAAHLWESAKETERERLAPDGRAEPVQPSNQ